MRWGSVGRLVPFALAACLALSLPATAEDAAPSTGHGSPAAAPAKVEVSIPVVQAVNSSIDEATLRSIFMGDIAGHAAELAALKASSIRVPELRITYATPAIKGVAQTGTLVMRDVRLQKVAKGVAQAIIIGSYESTSSNGGTAKLGKVSAEDFDIGGLLAFVGLVKGDPASPRKALYRDFRASGGTVVSDKASCTLGPSSVMRVSARPLKVSFVDLFEMAKKIADSSDDQTEQGADRDFRRFLCRPRRCSRNIADEDRWILVRRHRRRGQADRGEARHHDRRCVRTRPLPGPPRQGHRHRRGGRRQDQPWRIPLQGLRHVRPAGSFEGGRRRHR